MRASPKSLSAPLTLRSLCRGRVSAAHPMLAARPELVAGASHDLATVLGAISNELGMELKATVTLVSETLRLRGSTSALSAFAVFDLGRCGSVALLEVERSFLAALVGRLSGESTGRVPAMRLTRIERTAFGFLCVVAAASLGAESTLERHFAPRLLDLVDDRLSLFSQLDAATPQVAADVSLSLGELSTKARLWLAARAFVRVLERFPEVATATAPELAAARVVLTPRLGRTSFPAAELWALRPGDVVVLDDVHLHEGVLHGRAVLRGPTFLLEGEAAAGGFAIGRAVTRHPSPESPMRTQTENDDVSPLLIELEVQLAKVRMTVAELGQVKPGAVLPLHLDTAPPVLLKVGDRTVASAELVEVDGQVGARVIAFLRAGTGS